MKLSPSGALRAALLLPALLLASARSATADGPGAIDTAHLLSNLGTLRPSTQMQRAEDGTPLAVSPQIEARFGPSGARITPVLGGRAQARWDLLLSAVELGRGDLAIPLSQSAGELRGDRVVYHRAPGVEERFDSAGEGLLHSLWIEAPIAGAGDLWVRFALGGNLAQNGQRLSDGSHRFDGGEGGLSYGTLLAIDARGEQVQGEVRIAPNGLEWRIPEAFADRASWPLLLDPVIGPIAPIPADSVGEFDLAFDTSTQRYLLAFERRLSSSEKVLRGSFFSPSGAPLGGLLALSEVTTARAPKVANANGSNRFAVVWTQVFFGESQVRLRLVDAATGALSSTAFLKGEPEGNIGGADVVGEQIVGLSPQVWVVWDSSSEGIRGARVSVPASGNPATLGNFTVAPDPGILDRLDSASLAASISGGGRIGVVWTRKNLGFGTSRAFAASFDRAGVVVQGPTQVSPTGAFAQFPAIDGGGGFNNERFVIAWCDGAAGTRTTQAISWRPAAASQLSAPVVLSSSLWETQPAVAWKQNNKAYVLHRAIFIQPLPGCSPTIVSVRLTGLNAEDCSTCEPTEELFAGSGSLVCGSGPSLGAAGLALVAAYGEPASPLGWVACAVSSGSFAGFQLLPVAIDSPFATAVNQGGGCGASGPIVAPTAPYLGNPNFRIRYEGLPGTAQFAWLNLAAPTPGFACGPCQWLPFQTVFPLSISAAGTASLELPIPCLPSLAGVTLDAQFTLLEPTSAACPVFPGFAVTDILRLTLD